MKLWIDDVRPAPDGYHWIKTANATLLYLTHCSDKIEIIDLDHDAGVYAPQGGDYINILNYLEVRAYKGYKVKSKFRIHSFNPVGVVNMRAIIERNGWEEVR